jgi:hypothetical protein
MARPSSLGKELCRCIKKVRTTVKLRRGQNKSVKSKGKGKGKEKAAIGICVKSVLHTRGKTLRRFKCRPKPYLHTQKYK